MLTHVQLRNKFAEFWKKNNHKEIPPIPLVPQNDPTTLFTGSGMQQLVPYLLGEPHPQGKRIFDIQPCFRSQDIEEVGDNRHTTFFEMMGNWSLGDYFKKEQLIWFWNFLTVELKLPKEKLYVTVFAGDKKNNLPPDEESIQIWGKIGIPENKIFKYGPERNWWSRAGVPDNMPAGEPGGPDSEVFYEFTQIPHDKKFGEKCHPNCDCGRFMEIGNSVFMQYKKNDDGSFSDLPAMNVDFGGGLERILAAENNDPDVFKTDAFLKIISEIERLSGKIYENNNKSKMRIIADHLKGATFLITGGVRPGNKEHGYVLRRLLRRSAIKMHELTDGKTTDFAEIADIGVLKTYDGAQGIERKKLQKEVIAIIAEEIKKFNLSITKGLKEIKKMDKVDGKIAFDLYQNFGFPYELTEELFREKGQEIDKKQFVLEFNKHKDLSRSASAGKFKGGLADHSEQTIKYHTATHLLHQALFDVVGSDIRQEGSNITTDRLRFDFASTLKPTEEQIKKVEKIINNKIKESLPVEYKIVPKEEALKLGAKSFFREKYPDMVKVYFIKNYSKEFCGGPHVKNTFEIGKIQIYKFEKIGSNLYRIYAK
ncbi:MAG: alanine--tRNA ligase [Patescibacteria group bacterium]